MDTLTIALVLVLLFVLWLLVHNYAKPTVHITDGKKRHEWLKKNDITHFCNICELLLNASEGFVCAYCSVACDKASCMKIADKKIRCKQQRERKEIAPESVVHHFIKGNLEHSTCKSCKLEIENFHEPGIHGTRCCWCHESFHDQCATSDLICDFGPYREFVIPPFAVKANRTRKAPTLHLTGITQILEWENWEPLIVIANINSGSAEAEEVATMFRRILNPIQVVSLSSRGPAEALEIVKLSPVKCRVLVCGGDGSTSWVLNTINEMKLDDKVSVAICPIGTGNDLSRVMGWGAEINDSDLHSPNKFIEKIRNAERIDLDRWQMEVKFDNRSMISRRLHHDKKFFMYNYFSVGVDALVTLNFHKARASAFYIVKSKIINKFMYFLYGTQQVLIQDCDHLDEKIDIFIDGLKVELPELQSIVTLNIDSWGAGVKLVEMLKENEKSFADSHSMSDGLAEVFGVSSSFHIAQLQVGLAKPIKLGRAKEVKV
jgi:diacylglycerol kinase (ATP)